MTNAKTITRPTADQSPAEALWRISLTAYQTAKAAYEAASADYGTAGAAFLAEVGELNPDFARYGVNQHRTDRTRDDHIRFVEGKIAIADYAGQRVSADDYAAIAKKAAQLVDTYETDIARREEAEARILDAPEAKWQTALDALAEAREALFRTPAPDASALLAKLDLLTTYLNECESEDKERVAAVADDVRRLFGGK
jgi:hypothetical protein